MATTQTNNKTVAKRDDPRHAIANCGPRIPYHPVMQEKFGVDSTSWKSLVEAVFPNATTMNSVVLALSYCKARRLDPFKRCVHIVPIWSSDQKCMVDTIWPGIGELRTTAFRTGEYAGRAHTEFGPDVTKEWTSGDGKVSVTFPEWAQVTVFRMIKGQRVEFCGPRVYWLETYANKSRSDAAPNSMWQDRPRGQIDKCFDSETEVLTDQGFQRFGFVTGRIMEVTDNGLAVTNVEPFCRSYDGPMVICDGNALNFSVTPNHDMATSQGKVEAGKVFADSTSSKGYEIPMTLTQSQSASELDYTDSQLTLAAAVVCDGYRSKGRFEIAVSRASKLRDVESLGLHSKKTIRRCAGDLAHTAVRTIETKADKTVFRFERDVCGDLLLDSGCLNTDAIRLLSRRQARIVADQMIRFDGATSRTARRFYSSDIAVIGSFELVCVIAGYSVSTRRERTSDVGGRNWYVTLSTKERCKTLKASASQSRLKGGMRMEVNTDGVVWCCRVPSGYIVVRRKGLSMICGNCAEAAALRAAFPEEIGGDFIPEEVQHDRGIINAPSVNIGESRTESLLGKIAGNAESEAVDGEPSEAGDTTASSPNEATLPANGKLFDEGPSMGHYEEGH